MTTSICLRALAYSGLALMLLGAPVGLAGTDTSAAVIRGIVTLSCAPPDSLRGCTGQGIGGVLVTFQPDAGGETRQVLTNDDGGFLAHLEPGCYIVVAARDTAIGRVPACTDVDLVLQIDIAEPQLKENSSRARSALQLG